MSIAYVDSPMTWDDVLTTWRDLDLPEGWRAEFTTEGISMTPPPGGLHNLIADLVHRQLLSGLPDGCGLFQTLGVGFPHLGGIYIPDFSVVPRAAVPQGADPALAENVLLVVEITSPGNANHDRTKKKWMYAHGRIPQYLLIDPWDELGASVSLFTKPADGAYNKTVRAAFGQPLSLEEPFGVELDTSEF